MKAHPVRDVATSARLVAVLACACPCISFAGTTAFFDNSQTASLVATGTTSDTISGEGYAFTYTRDKLFTGGVGLTNPVGRFTTINWPTGVQAQAVTAGPSPGKAQVTIQRKDLIPFTLASFTFKLLANTAGAGASLEVMPVLNGEDALNDPLYFDASGYGGQLFHYDTTPNYLGSTAALTNYDGYKIALYVDFALVALALESKAPDLCGVHASDTGLVLEWDSLPDQFFTVQCSTNLRQGFFVVGSNIPATGARTTYTIPLINDEASCWKIVTEP